MNAATSDTKDEIKVQDLASLVAGLSRFLTRLSNMPAFQETGGLGLAEWSALSLIAEKSGIGTGQLANLIGVSAPRVHQITESLKAASLISISPDAGDARKKVLTITPAGTKRLNDSNAKLQPMIEEALRDRPQALNRGSRLINRVLMRLVIPRKPEASKTGKR